MVLLPYSVRRPQWLKLSYEAFRVVPVVRFDSNRSSLQGCMRGLGVLNPNSSEFIEL